MVAPDAQGFNGNVTIFIAGSGLFVRDVVANYRNTPFFGHIHIYDTTDHYSVNSADSTDPVLTVIPNRDFSNGSLMCAEGWEKVGSSYVLEGRPCVTIHT